MSVNQEFILEILLESGLVSHEQLEQAQGAGQGTSAVESLMQSGILSEEDYMRALATHASMEFVDVLGFNVSEEILGVVIRKVVIPVAAGRNLAVLLEAAVRNHILRLRGIDSTAEFMARQSNAIQLDEDDEID